MLPFLIACVQHFEPSIESISVAVAFIRRHIAAGHTVLVHCRGGHGRSAAVVVAHLALSTTMTPREANAYVYAQRRCRKAVYSQPNVSAFIAAEKQKQQTK